MSFGNIFPFLSFCLSGNRTQHRAFVDISLDSGLKSLRLTALKHSHGKSIDLIYTNNIEVLKNTFKLKTKLSNKHNRLVYYDTKMSKKIIQNPRTEKL